MRISKSFVFYLIRASLDKRLIDWIIYQTFSLLHLKNQSPSLLLRHLSLLVHLSLLHPLRFRSNSLRIRFPLYVVLNYLFLSLSNFIIWSGPNSCTRCCGPTSANSCSPKTSINPEDNCRFLLCTSFKPLSSSYSSTLKTSSTGGFAAFAGSASLFASPSSSSKPIWTTSKSERTFDHKNESEISGSSSSIEAFKPAKDIGTSEVTLATSKYTR